MDVGVINAGCSLDVHDPHILECPVIVDGRNVVDADRFIGEGFVYRGLGEGTGMGRL